MAGQLYAAFRECGINGSESVPVCLAAEDRSVIAAAILAALASNTVLSLPHNLSATALSQMRENTGFDHAVVDGDRDLPDRVRSLFCSVDGGHCLLPASTPDPEATLLQLFTGGSTGSPKVWSKTAANIFAEARFMIEDYQITAADTILATVTPSHIYGLLFSVVIPLLSGCRVVANNPSFPAEILDCAEREVATLLVSVPPHYRVLKGRHFPKSLRLALSSAGMLSVEDNGGFCHCNDVGIVEIYGSTETGGIARRNRFRGETFFSPLLPLNCHIKNQRLLLQSPFLSPDLPRDADGFFLSGDRVQQEANGCFSLHGRADAVTKVAGVRVDLDEVREVLREQPGVEECVVISLEEQSGRGSRIAALVRGEGVDVKQIRQALGRRLDPAALPKRILLVAAIPVTATGKYDREGICALLLKKCN
jgi:acyl-coenzyme A synthetase/AMP-(fatty) acid ligase